MTYAVSGPSALTLPGVQTVSAGLTFENTGAATETVSVGGFTPQRLLPRAGATMDPQGYPALENTIGTSTITGMSITTASYPSGLCLAVVPDNTTGVYGDPSYGLSLSVPPGARGVVTQRFRVGDFPARPGDSFAVQFGVEDSGGRRTIAAPEPQRLGPSGVNITVGLPAVVKSNHKRFVISGSTDPVVAGQIVSIHLNDSVRPSRTAPTIGSARTDSQGRFRLKRKLPKRGGSYTLSASYLSQSPSFASDTSCGTGIALPARPKGKRKKAKKTPVK